ncbi:DUF11 domain-containing protein [Nonomuraea aridisoli]|uniref:DUF11 domain-containing protein n=1 Tax=Nonomuraea aridisoli TaxID=2070368 RepID=A0A2W2EJW4_9ACTN|nr:DUF11 domain-containing protein [Nonomuraea aridisoli]PZG13850.1 hypothetical protein C1J01_28725 [Nonomuraea aridisoli]
MGRPGIAAVVALTVLSGTGASAATPPELRITASVSPEPMVAGAQAVYALTVANAGGRDAGEVAVTATLDRNVVPGPLPDDCGLAARTVTCAGPAVPAGRAVTYAIPFTTDPGLADGTVVTHQAQVAGGDVVPLSARVRSAADVGVVKTGRLAAGGDRVTYTVTVTNRGPSRAVDVAVRDSAGAERATVVDRPAECPGAGPDLDCPIGALVPEESRTFRYTVAADTAGPVGSCATVRAGGRDDNPANDRSCAETMIEPARSPSTSATPAPGPVGSPTPDARTPEPSERRRAGAGPAGRDERKAEDEQAPPVAEVTGRDRAEPGASRPRDVAKDDAVRPADHGQPALPLTGASLWTLGLGIAVLLAIGLLVSCLSRRDEADRAR